MRALEEDRVFRYAMMGLLGFKELLERFAKLEERQVRLEERQQKLEERQQALEERFAQLEERFAKLEERFAQLEERFAKLEERVSKLEERFIRVEEELRDLRRIVMAVSHRFGILSEEAFREGMKYVVEEVFGVARVERWVHKDNEGYVYGYPSIVEVDVIIKDREHILIEVKSRVSKSDVAELFRIGKLYERIEGVTPKLVIIGGFIDRGAREAAKALGVDIRPIAE
ncbi:MAG: DUF3782 domain-containing protein [Desulfurococcales archaeon]|nr:DUF3782 domain-containing protein [Desulfurococcales archaeon]